MDKKVFLSLLISSLAGISTLLGGLIVYFKIKDKDKFITFALSFSLSVMISLSVLELIPEGFITLTNNYGFLIGLSVSIILFLIGKLLVTKTSNRLTLLEGKGNLYRVGVLSMIALALHNFPEGIATFMASFNDLSSGISLGLAIMLHNIPEGISISVPVYYATGSKKRGVVYSFISGLAEPIGALLAYICLKNYINDVLIAITLIIVAGIMVTLSINEMLPEVNSYNKKKESYIGLILGLIMVLINNILF